MMWSLIDVEESEGHLLSNTYRLTVPNGWLYRVTLYGPVIRGGQRLDAREIVNVSTVYVPAVRTSVDMAVSK